MLRIIERIRKALDCVIPYVSAILFLACVASTSLGTVNRTLNLHISTPWVEEVSIYSMVWATTLLIGYLLRKGVHTQFTLLADKLRGKSYTVWRLIILMIEFAVFGLLFIGGIQLTVNGSKMFMTAIHITMAWAYLCVPVGAGIALLELIMCFIEDCAALAGKRLG